MNWFDYVLLAWWTLSTVLVVGHVGRDRGVLEARTAAIVVVLNALLATGLLFSRGVLG